MPRRSDTRCLIVWYLDGIEVHRAITDTASAMLYKRWIRDDVHGFGRYTLTVEGITDE